MIDGQFEIRGRAFQSFAPKIDLFLQHLSPKPVALPKSVIGVLQFKRRKLHRLFANESGIQRHHFPYEHARRPTVGNDMMKGQ